MLTRLHPSTPLVDNLVDRKTATASARLALYISHIRAHLGPYQSCIERKKEGVLKWGTRMTDFLPANGSFSCVVERPTLSSTEERFVLNR